jgi:hypothetical protein
MRMNRYWISAALIGMTAVCAVGTQYLSGQRGQGASPEAMAIIAGDPPLKTQRLILEDIPKASAPLKNLFNGTDLTGWDKWLGFADPSKAYAETAEKPIGLNQDNTGVFTVVQEDGEPVIRISGKIQGVLMSKGEYGNYHLRLQYKWGRSPEGAAGQRPNSGLIYHSHGPLGACFGNWMAGLEFAVWGGAVGALIPVGASEGAKSFAEMNHLVGVTMTVGQDPALPYPKRRFMVGGRMVSIAFPAYNVNAAMDNEKPAGEWNTIDLYAYRDGSIHVVNGTPVLQAANLTTSKSRGGPRIPLTSGRLQLESEGTLVFYRNITIEPIDRLPRIAVSE